MGSLALATKGQYMTGVSTDIGTSFVRPGGKPGDTLLMKSVLTGMGMCIIHACKHVFASCFSGKSLAYTRTDFMNPAGELVAYGCNLFPFTWPCSKSFSRGFLTHVACIDHTKYIGKSSSHPVSYLSLQKVFRVLTEAWNIRKTSSSQRMDPSASKVTISISLKLTYLRCNRPNRSLLSVSPAGQQNKMQCSIII